MLTNKGVHRKPQMARSNKTKLESSRAKHPPAAPLPNAIVYRVDEVGLMGGPRRSKLYQLAAQGRIRMIRAGGRTLFDGDSVRNFLRGDG